VGVSEFDAMSLDRVVFQVQLAGTASVEAVDIRGMLATLAAPRPGQEFTVLDDAEHFTAEVVYLHYPDAPAFEVSYMDLARAWGELVGDGKIPLDESPAALPVRDALLVVDHACAHLRARYSR